MFPNYQNVTTTFLFLFKKNMKIRDGWEGIGLMPTWTEIVNNETWIRWEIHPFCKNKIHLGKENGEVFKYCPVCMIKTT